MSIVRHKRTVTGSFCREGVSCAMMDEPGNLPDVCWEKKEPGWDLKIHFSSEEKSK